MLWLTLAAISADPWLAENWTLSAGIGIIL